MFVTLPAVFSVAAARSMPISSNSNSGSSHWAAWAPLESAVLADRSASMTRQIPQQSYNNPTTTQHKLNRWNLSSLDQTSNVTGRHRGVKQKLQAGYRVQSLQRTSCPDCRHYNARHIFHHRVWYHTLFLRYACIWHSGIILVIWRTKLTALETISCWLLLKKRKKSLFKPPFRAFRGNVRTPSMAHWKACGPLYIRRN